MKYFLLPVLGLLIGLSGFAQEGKKRETTTVANDTVKTKNGETLKEVVVAANKQRQPVSAVRSGIKIMDLPQSVQIIGSDVIEQQQDLRLSDVVKNMNGVYVGSSRGSMQESLYSRGYDITYSNNNIFKNGFRTSGGSIPEISSLERVELLKGSAALLYGNVTPGGILNLVTKTPKFTRGGEVSMQMGSYSFYKPSIDFYGPINKHIAYRITGTYENSKSFRDIVKNERYYINPSFLFKLDDKTQITLQGDYLNYDWTPDYGTGFILKKSTGIPRNKYLGAIWSNGKTIQTSVSALINHDFNKDWKLNFNSSFQKFHRSFKGTENVDLDAAAIANIPNYKYGDTFRPLLQNNNSEQIVGEQLSVQGNFNIGKVKNQLFTGVDFENSFLSVSASPNDYGFNGNTVKDAMGRLRLEYYDRVNIYDLTYDNQRTDIPNTVVKNVTHTDSNRLGIYVQDLISVTEQFKVLVGVRWSLQQDKVEKTKDFTPNVVTKSPKSTNSAFSPKLGLIYQPTTDISIFATYSNSFSPNTGVTVSGDPLKPSIIDQYEIGVKKDWWKGLLSTNITVYQIKNNNFAQRAQFNADGTPTSTSSNIRVLSGQTKSRGTEIDITARPVAGLSIIAGYSNNDMRYTKTSGLDGSNIEGSRLRRVPVNTANFSFFYTLQSTVLKGLSVGAIGNYSGDKIGGWDNTHDSRIPGGIRDREIPLKGYTTVDVSLGYAWRKISLLCKLSNVGNTLNYVAHESISVNPIPPRQVLATLRYNF